MSRGCGEELRPVADAGGGIGPQWRIGVPAADPAVEERWEVWRMAAVDQLGEVMETVATRDVEMAHVVLGDRIAEEGPGIGDAGRGVVDIEVERRIGVPG